MTIRLERDGAVALLIIDRPEAMNALDVETLTALRDRLLELREHGETRVIVLTGAGVSAESGIPTFRGVNGLWRNYRIEEVASPHAWARDPRLVWEFYSMRRRVATRRGSRSSHPSG